MKKYFSFIILLLSTNFALADLAVDVDKLFLSDKSTHGTWLALKSVGWRLKVETRKGNDVEINTGNPLDYKSIDAIKSEKCIVLCLSLKKSTTKSAHDLKTNLAESVKNKLPKLPATIDGYRLKISANARDIAMQFTRSFRWPEPQVDALGTGFNNYFKRQDITLKDLIERNLIEKGEYKSIDEIYQTPEELAHYASWVKKSSITSTTAIRSLLKGIHSSGCQIALNSIMWSLVHSTYDDTNVFDKSYDEVILNNAHFRETKLFGKMTYDNSGLEKAKRGAHYMIGEAGYLTALFDDKVDNPDYSGENFIITSMTDAAVDDFIKIGGFGFSQKGQSKTSNHSGLTKLMIKYWQNNDETVLNRPIFNGTTIWGHPGGELTLAGWLRELRYLNPRTPYGVFIYEYHLAQKQWQNLVDAYKQKN